MYEAYTCCWSRSSACGKMTILKVFGCSAKRGSRRHCSIMEKKSSAFVLEFSSDQTLLVKYIGFGSSVLTRADISQGSSVVRFMGRAGNLITYTYITASYMLKMFCVFFLQCGRISVSCAAYLYL